MFCHKEKSVLLENQHLPTKKAVTRQPVTQLTKIKKLNTIISDDKMFVVSS